MTRCAEHASSDDCKLQGVQGYWSRKARDRGILTEKDLERYLHE
jgi:hypothetical protein